MAINYSVIREILSQLHDASPLGIKDETKITITETPDISDEEKRAYLDWLEAEGYIRFRVFGTHSEKPKGTAQDIIITEEGINKLLHHKL